MFKTISKFSFFFFISLITICLNSFADEVWVKDLINERFYLSIEQTEQGFKLHHYHQLRGDYPDHLFEKYFSDRKPIMQLIDAEYADYQLTEKLTKWEVRPVTLKSKGKMLHAHLWAVTNQWNEDWENKYSEWIQQEIDPDFYHKHNIATDCADAVIGLRWIFARMHGLPVANTLAETDDLFGHYSMRRIWQTLPTAENWYDDKLFLTALKYVMDLASTRTIILDGYPVKINRDGLRPGTYILTQSPSSGHVKFISENHYAEAHDLPIYTLSSTSPRDLRLLTREVFLDQDWPERTKKEILAFRWPVQNDGIWTLLESAQHPQYSEEQFDPVLKESYPAFINFVVTRVKNNYDPIKLVELTVEDILDSVKRRALIVEKGYEYCQSNDCAEGTIGHEDWGTPSRDSQLKAKFENIDKLVRDYQFMAPTLQSQWVDGLRLAKIKLMGRETNLSVIRFLVDHNLLSSAPAHTPAKRWGFHKEELVKKWTEEASSLFVQRDAIIEKTDGPCSSQECYPKNLMWLDLNTYHLDTALSRIYVTAVSYCALVDKTACDLLQTANLTKTKKSFNNKTKSFAEWFKAIPFFHSDPRVSKARRWGELPDYADAHVLPYYNTIKIAENSLALIDGRKIYNLKDGKLITEIKDDNRIFLSDSGVAYKINDNTGELKRLSWSSDGTGLWRRVTDKQGVLQKEKLRKLVFVDEGGYFYFKKPFSDGHALFTVKQDKIETIARHKGSITMADGLIAAGIDKDMLAVYDFERGSKKEIVSTQIPGIKDMNALIVSSYSYPEILFDYRDRDNDLYFPVVFNLEKMEGKRLDPLPGEKMIVKWSSAKQRKAFVQSRFNLEFPELHAIRWNESGEVEIARLGNMLFGTKELDGKIYFINGQGGQWDQNPQKELMVWDQEDIKSIIAPADSSVRFFSSVGPYFSSENSGILITFDAQKNYRLPKDVLEKNSLCDLQINAEKIFVYRFSTNYGDYSCMGGGFATSKKSEDDEVIPDFSLYAWINNESLLDQRWQKDFSNSVVKSGTLIALGKNLSLWWKPID